VTFRWQEQLAQYPFVSSTRLSVQSQAHESKKKKKKKKKKTPPQQQKKKKMDGQRRIAGKI